MIEYCFNCGATHPLRESVAEHVKWHWDKKESCQIMREFSITVYRYEEQQLNKE